MPFGTKNDPDVGKRVQIPAYAEKWMRGARFGTVERVIDNSHKRFVQANDPRAATIYRVRLDRAPRKLHGFIADDCSVIPPSDLRETRTFLYRRGDGNEGNFARMPVILCEDDCAFAALRALVINDFVSGHHRRRFIARNLETDGESDRPYAMVYEGPRGARAINDSAWLTAELEPIEPADIDESGRVYTDGGVYVAPTPIRDALDKGARQILESGE